MIPPAVFIPSRPTKYVDLLSKMMTFVVDFCCLILYKDINNKELKMIIDPTLLSIYSDMYKDLHGFRPRGEMPFTSDAELRAEMNRMGDQIEREIEDERALEEQAWKLVHGRITACALAKNCTWQEALQTLVEFDGAYDIDEFMFNYGVNYRIALKVMRLFEVEGSFLDLELE